jgi:hypothetical protein
MAVQRVAAGTASTIESAVWSITYGDGYLWGRSDAHIGRPPDCLAKADEGYKAGYERGYQWTIDHPVLPAT